MVLEPIKQLFGKESKGKNIHVSPRVALYLAALSVISADGTIVTPESNDVEKIVRGDKKNFEIACQTFSTTSYHDVVELVARSLSADQQVALIAILLDLSMADGVLVKEEEQIIMAYVTKFGIPAYVFKDLCHYISLKNNFALFDTAAPSIL
ncbi:MAG: hypothetical protein GYA23_06415 [Methanomicrobiales archaeon]|nr:hypothetical protein [Methanomicrobiales archaeon]